MKRLRVEGELEEVGFVGTRFEGFGDGERRKNWCAVELDEGICLFADQETNRGSVLAALEEATNTSFVSEPVYSDGDAGESRTTEKEEAEKDYNSFQTAQGYHVCLRPFQSRHAQVMSDSDRIDAMIDKLASPISLGRIDRRQSPPVVRGDIAGADEIGGVQEERHALNANVRPLGAATQSVISSCEMAVSPGNAAAQNVSKDSSTTETDHREYLHAFVTRAKAKKAAMLNQESTTHYLAASSPQTRSRTALTMLDRNSSSPTSEVGLRERKLEHENIVVTDVGETSPSRKSNQTRLPRSQRNQPATPNMIHFRRPNGTEFIFLQKTDAQRIAIATRSNTRRNRGEGLQPRMKLEVLSTQTQPSPTKIERKKKKNSKQVSWDEGLAYFAPEQVPATMASVEEQPEQKTPVKRSRRLAQGKGTPAPKEKMAETAMDIETPSTKRRARTSAKSKRRSKAEGIVPRHGTT